ncbi:MAG: sulfotransferase [Nocardioidaceae bacterium]
MDAGPTMDSAGQETPSTGPIFVVGTMRSGSTMLRLILDSHPRIAIGAETGFMGALLATKTIPNWKYGSEWYQRLAWTEEELDQRLRDFYNGMFDRHAAGQGKRRWGEKTPFHTAHMAAMARMFPSAVFVGIVRHPGAVAASLRKSFHYSFADALSYWTATNLDMVRAATELGPRFVACRYEDLVLEGEPVLRELVAWLGEPWSPNLLQHHVVQREKGAPRAADGSTSTRDAIDAKRAVRWAQSATDDDLQALESTAALAGFFGYEPVEPMNRHGLLAPDSPRLWLPTGDDLRSRRSDWEHRIDFDERPPTLAIDSNPEQLAKRLSQVEGALARTRSRKAVRMADAFRKVQHGRSWQDLRKAWGILRGQRT